MVIFPRAYFKRNIISHCIVWPQNIYGHLNIQYKLLRNMMRCVYVSYSVSVWQQTWLQLKLNGIKTHLRTEMSTVDNTSLPVQQISKDQILINFPSELSQMYSRFQTVCILQSLCRKGISWTYRGGPEWCILTHTHTYTYIYIYIYASVS